EYKELGKAVPMTPHGNRDFSRLSLPQHGVARELFGIRSDDGEWLYVLPKTWREIAAEFELDSSVACMKLFQRGILHVPPAMRKRGDWQATPKIDGISTRVYQLRYADVVGDGVNPKDNVPVPVPPEPVREPCSTCQAPGEWCGFGEITSEAAPCVICGEETKIRSACGTA